LVIIRDELEVLYRCLRDTPAEVETVGIQLEDGETMVLVMGNNEVIKN